MKPVKAYIDSPDKYVQKCWEKCIEQVPLQDAQFVYEDYDTQDFEARDPQKLYYSYVFRKGLIRKNYLANRIAYHCAKHPETILSSAFPESFNLEVDYAEFLDDSLDEAYELRQAIDEGNKTWIIKPAMADRAEGIFIFRTIDALQEILDEWGSEEDGELPFRHFVVQEYLDAPLVVDKRKFHIRTYVVCLGALKVWVYDDMLALFSGQAYTKVSSDKVTDLGPHLTNTCAQKKDSFDANVVRLLSKLPIEDSMKSKIISGIHTIVHDLFEAQVADPVNFQPLPNALEFYGLDFLVREDGQPVLLEANAYPDFAQTGELQALVEGLFKDTASVAINGHFTGRSAEEPNLSLVYDEQIR